MPKRYLIIAGKYGLGLVMLALFIRQFRGPLADQLKNPLQVGPLIAAVFLYAASQLMQYYRWYTMVRAQDLPITFYNAVRLGLIGFCFNTVLPGSIGGDIVKAAFIAREQSRRTVAVATVLIDRGIGLWALVWVVAIAGGYAAAMGNPIILDNPKLRALLLGAAAAVVLTVLVWILIGMLPEWRAQRFAGRLERIPKLGHILSDFWKAVWLYRLRGIWIVRGMLISVGAQLLYVVGFYYASQIFSNPQEPLVVPSWTEHFLLVPIGMAVQAFIPTPGGIGGAELVFGELLSNGAMGAIFQRAILWVMALFGYLVYLGMKPALAQIDPPVSRDALAEPATES